MILLNPLKKSKKKAKGSTKKKSRKYSKKKSRPKAKKVCYRTSGRDAIRRWACSPKRARSLSASDAYNLCGRGKYGLRSKPKAVKPWFADTSAAGIAAAKNPGGLSNVTAAFKPNLLMNALPLAAGVLLNYKLTPMIASRVGTFAQSGVGNVVTGLATAGLTLLIPKVGTKLFAGGMVRVMLGDVIPLIKNLVMPPAPKPIPVAPAAPLKDFPIVDEGDEVGLSGLADDGEEDIP